MSWMDRTDIERFNVIHRDLEGYYGLSDNKGESVITNLYMGEHTAKEMCNWLNGREDEIQELKQRNKRQCERLKEITDLMQNRDWESLEKMVKDWEEAEELLQAEWGTYCE